ncbi:MAG TPA: XRE family transcriptional regulator [Desulfotomaculum sp.]|nr:XRE family transcriptional regulator [Desulfotomaculum sp.]
MDLSNRLKALRKLKGWTQEELAARTGVTRDTIAGYESKVKRRQPNPEMLIRLANTFGVTVDCLLGLTDNKIAEETAAYVAGAKPEQIIILIPCGSGRFELRTADDSLAQLIKDALAQGQQTKE